MNINRGHVVYEYEADLEYKRLVEDFIDSGNLAKSALNQFANSVMSLRDLKEKITINKETNIFYWISIRKFLDTLELKNALKEVSDQREAISRSGDYLSRKIEEYNKHVDQDEDSKRVEVVRNMFIGYSKMYLEGVEKQIALSVKYLIRVKKIEVASQEDKEYFSEIEGDMLKNDSKLKAITQELNDVWLKVSESVIEGIVDDIKMAIDDISEEDSEESVEEVSSKEEVAE